MLTYIPPKRIFVLIRVQFGLRLLWCVSEAVLREEGRQDDGDLDASWLQEDCILILLFLTLQTREEDTASETGRILRISEQQRGVELWICLKPQEGTGVTGVAIIVPELRKRHSLHFLRPARVPKLVGKNGGGRRKTQKKNKKSNNKPKTVNLKQRLKNVLCHVKRNTSVR